MFLSIIKTYSELIQLAERGDRHNVDLLVKDTAGSHYNVSPDNMVSSFGKAAKLGVKNPSKYNGSNRIITFFLLCISLSVYPSVIISV